MSYSRSKGLGNAMNVLRGNYNSECLFLDKLELVFEALIIKAVRNQKDFLANYRTWEKQLERNIFSQVRQPQREEYLELLRGNFSALRDLAEKHLPV